MIFSFLFYYFKETYNTESYYLIQSESDSYKLNDGILITTRMFYYLKLGTINNENKKIKLYIKNNDTRKLVYEGMSDLTIIDYPNYNAYFMLMVI